MVNITTEINGKVTTLPLEVFEQYNKAMNKHLVLQRKAKYRIISKELRAHGVTYDVYILQRRSRFNLWWVTEMERTTFNSIFHYGQDNSHIIIAELKEEAKRMFEKPYKVIWQDNEQAQEK